MAPRLDKETIDALVDAMPRDSEAGDGWRHCWIKISEGRIEHVSDVTRRLYLAAGLTAEGERKPGRVRCWQVSYPRLSEPAKWYATEAPSRTSIAHDAIVTPGWFVPDGAE